MMKNQTHPLEEMSERITEHGLMIIEGVHQMPVYGKPYVSPFIIVGLNHQGWMKTNFDMRIVEFHRHDLAVLPPGHILLAHESSNDYQASLLVISPQFLKKLSNYYTFSFEQIEFQYNSAFHLDDEQFDNIFGLFRMLKGISQMNYLDRDDLLAKQLEIGSYLINSYLFENNSLTKQDFTADQQLLNRFKNAVVKHFTKSREVQYYADLLCLSPKYFGSIIKQQSGITAGELITRYVIIQAKSLLRHRKDLNIQQISHQLGFSDPASFTRFFKANVGMSPKVFRTQQ